MKKETIDILERQGCFSSDWSRVIIDDETDLSRIRNVFFRGDVSVGKGTEIINVPGGLANVRIGDGVRIVNVARIENSHSATFGLGTDVAVLDETGGRSVRIYPGISAQIAAIATRMPEYAEERLRPMIDIHIKDMTEVLKERPEIGDGAEIRDCGPIIDVRVWPGVKVEGAAWLRNGSIVSNEQDADRKPEERLAYVGQGVNAENFIIEDASVANGVILRNSYIGQGSVLDKGFTSHDSLFFANCAMENGEACAVLAGPYTVSMHKSSLLIGCQTAFMNAGSGTNMSNHLYKLGPVHWGVLERGVKTSSNSYIMHGSRIGAFSLVMGEHKTHPDTSEFPFSYLFGDKDGKTIVVPGAMLRSYGLKRDAEKWPKRDRRPGHCIRLNDRITFDVLNPHTVGLILDAIDLIGRLDSLQADSDGYITYNNLKVKKTSLDKGRRLYELALCKYIQTLKEKDDSEAPGTPRVAVSGQWVDLSGQIVAESHFREILNVRSIREMEQALDMAIAQFDANECLWVSDSMKDRLDLELATDLRASEFDALLEKDRQHTLARFAKENDMLTFI